MTILSERMRVCFIFIYDMYRYMLWWQIRKIQFQLLYWFLSCTAESTLFTLSDQNSAFCLLEHLILVDTTKTTLGAGSLRLYKDHTPFSGLLRRV